MNEPSADIIDLAQYRLRAAAWPCLEVTTTPEGVVRLRADLETSHVKALQVLAILSAPD